MAPAATALDSKMESKPGWLIALIFGVALAIGFVCSGFHLISDLLRTHSYSLSLGAALLVELGFEFAIGFPDTKEKSTLRGAR